MTNEGALVELNGWFSGSKLCSLLFMFDLVQGALMLFKYKNKFSLFFGNTRLKHL